jgi:hypothetical protein
VGTMSFTQDLNKVSPEISAAQAAELAGFIGAISRIPICDEIKSMSISGLKEWANEQGFNATQIIHDIKIVAINSAKASDQHHLASSWDEWISSDMSVMKVIEILETKFPHSSCQLADIAEAALQEQMDLKTTGGGNICQIFGGAVLGGAITAWWKNKSVGGKDKEIAALREQKSELEKANQTLEDKNRWFAEREDQLARNYAIFQPREKVAPDSSRSGTGDTAKQSAEGVKTGAKEEISTQADDVEVSVGGEVETTTENTAQDVAEDATDV